MKNSIRYNYVVIGLIFVIFSSSVVAQEQTTDVEALGTDSLITVRTNWVKSFYELLGQETVSSNQLSAIYHIEREWSFVNTVFSTEEQSEYYDADWDSNMSPIMAYIKQYKRFIYLLDFIEFEIIQDENDINLLTAYFRNQEEMLCVKFKFYEQFAKFVTTIDKIIFEDDTGAIKEINLPR